MKEDLAEVLEMKAEVRAEIFIYKAQVKKLEETRDKFLSKIETYSKMLGTLENQEDILTQMEENNAKK